MSLKFSLNINNCVMLQRWYLRIFKLTKEDLYKIIKPSDSNVMVKIRFESITFKICFIVHANFINKNDNNADENSKLNLIYLSVNWALKKTLLRWTKSLLEFLFFFLDFFLVDIIFRFSKFSMNYSRHNLYFIGMLFTAIFIRGFK